MLRPYWLASAMLIAMALVQIADGVQSTALGALRGIRDFAWPTGFTLACYWTFALPLAALLGFGLDAGPLGVWAGYGAGIALAAIVLPLRYRVLVGRLTRLDPPRHGRHVGLGPARSSVTSTESA